MARSFGLKAYRALSGRTSDPCFVPSSMRPSGSLLWIHAAEPGNLLAIYDLADRLRAARYELTVLITLPDASTFEKTRENWTPRESTFLELVPSEHPEAVASFWNHWSPDMCLWVWGRLRPNLLTQAHRSTCPVVLVDADVAGLDGRRDRWLPDLSRQLLEPCAAILVRSNAALQKMESLDLPKGRVRLTPPLVAGGRALPCDDTDLTDLTSTLRGRPVWLANSIHPDELAAVLAAHRTAMKLSHRLLLVLLTARPAFDKQFKEAIQSEGYRLADWDNGEEPDEASQVLLFSDSRDLGLFYRVAPVTFMGGSLGAGHTGRNPFEAAALGSAVLYGPNNRRFMPFYKRLADAGAARLVKDEQSLGTSVTRLIAPDQAAAMAHAGWDVVSEGAAVTDRVIDLVQAGLDGDLEGANARP